MKDEAGIELGTCEDVQEPHEENNLCHNWRLLPASPVGATSEGAGEGAEKEAIECANTAEKSGTYAQPAEDVPIAGIASVTSTTETIPARMNTTASPETMPVAPPVTTMGGNGYAELLAACKEFVRKCEHGEAKSKRSYEQMKAAIAEELTECEGCGEFVKDVIEDEGSNLLCIPCSELPDYESSDVAKPMGKWEGLRKATLDAMSMDDDYEWPRNEMLGVPWFYVSRVFAAKASPRVIFELLNELATLSVSEGGWIDCKQELPPYDDKKLYWIWREGYDGLNADKNGPDVTTMQDQSMWHTRNAGHRFGISGWQHIIAPKVSKGEGGGEG